MRTSRAPAGVDILAGVALAVAVLWTCRNAIGIHDLNPDDANRAVVAKAQSLAEFRRAAGTELGQAAVLDADLRLSGGSASAAQIPALVMGVLAPIGVYVASRRAALTRVAAFGGGLVLACGREWGQAASLKANTWAGLATAALLVLGLDVLAAPSSSVVANGHRVVWRRFAGAAVVATICTIFGAMASASVLAALLVHLVRRRTPRRAWWRPAAGLVILLGAWALVVQRSTADVRDQASYPWFEPSDLIGSAQARLLAIGQGFAPWSADYSGRATHAGIALLLLALVGFGCLLARGNPLGLLALGPVVGAFGAAVAHLMPIGIRFDTWFFPALAVACAGAIDEVARRVPARAHVLGVGVATLVVVRMVNGSSYPEFRPSYRPVAAAARAVPGSECVVLDGVQLAQWAWDTEWDISILGQVPHETWIVVGFPGRCVSIPGYGPEWTGPDVLHTNDPPGARVWWISRTGAARAALPPSLAVVRETDWSGWTLAEAVRRP